MTRVDFYIISDQNPQSEDVIACRLAEKAIKQDYKVLILGQDNKHLQALDEKLWTFNALSFIPHEINHEPSDQATDHSPFVKIVLSKNDLAGQNANLLINLSGQVPAHFTNFERIAEIVPARTQDRQESRIRYKQYKNKECELLTHEL